MEQNTFSLRLAKLRTKKGVTAKHMSELLGRNPGYISKIESGKGYPSLDEFFRICDYLDIPPAEFFDTDNADPVHLREIISDLKRLDAKQLDMIGPLIKSLIGK